MMLLLFVLFPSSYEAFSFSLRTHYDDFQRFSKTKTIPLPSVVCNVRERIAFQPFHRKEMKLAMETKAQSSSGDHRPNELSRKQYSWSPKDLTKDNDEFLPIPDDDYVKKYQKNPEFWPVEFFVIVYRRTWNNLLKKNQTEILVRKSANGTSKWGLGTGVPATRWMLSSAKLPLGYKLSEPNIHFDASSFPEFPKNCEENWTYDKIEICNDAFNGPNVVDELRDSGLEDYAKMIRDNLRNKMTEQQRDLEKNGDEYSWDASRNSLVRNVLLKDNSVAAIQGTLRMSGVFGNRAGDSLVTNNDGDSTSLRFINLGNTEATKPSKLAESMKIYTMFPQMPDPMPSPSSSQEELKMEIESRPSRMAKSGRDPHKDKYGRKFTHISTTNVSNTIVGAYFTLDVTGLSGLDDVPAVDLFGTKAIKRHWVSLEDLKVLDSDGICLGTEDTKPTFISGYIVRQLVKEGIIDISD